MCVFGGFSQVNINLGGTRYGEVGDWMRGGRVRSPTDIWIPREWLVHLEPHSKYIQETEMTTALGGKKQSHHCVVGWEEAS